MGTKRICFILGTAALAACGGDNKAKPDAAKPIDAKVYLDAKVYMDGPPDAPPDAMIPYDFTCLGGTLPVSSAVANINVTVAGMEVASTSSEVPLNGAALAATMFQGGNPSAPVTGSATTNSTGVGTIAGLATNNLPLVGFVHATNTNDRDTYAFTGAPFATDNLLPLLMFTKAPMGGTFGTLDGLLDGGHQDDTANGNLSLLVSDCSESAQGPRPIIDHSNIVITVKQNGTTLCATGDTTHTTCKIIDFGGLQAAAAGSFLVFNVPAATIPPITVSATYTPMGGSAMNFLDVNVGVFAGAQSQAIIRPGPY
jgi:hypothetical protein